LSDGLTNNQTEGFYLSYVYVLQLTHSTEKDAAVWSRQARLKSDTVTSAHAQLLISFVSNSIGNRHCRNSTGLGDDNIAVCPLARLDVVIQNELANLGSFAAASVSPNDYHRVVIDCIHDVSSQS